MRKWAKNKLDQMVQEFEQGAGTPQLFECSFMCYLEAYAGLRGFDPAEVWVKHQALCKTLQVGDEPWTNLFTHTEGNKRLVVLLRGLQRYFEGPAPKSVKVSLPKVEPTGTVDILDLLSDFNEG